MKAIAWRKGLVGLAAAVVVLGPGAAGARDLAQEGKNAMPMVDLQLRLANLTTQEAALDELRALARSGALSSLDAVTLVLAAPNLPDGSKSESFGSTAARVLRVVYETPIDRSVVAAVDAVFSKLPTDARFTALAIELAIADGSGVASFLRNARASTGRLEGLPLQQLHAKTPHAKALFPALLELWTEKGWRADIAHAALVYAKAGKLDSALLAARATRLREHYAELVRRMGPRPKDAKGNSWMFEDEYADARREAGVLLDLMGHIEPSVFAAELQAALSSPDPHLQLCAAYALLRQGKAVAPSTIEAIASVPEVRGALLELLEELNRPALFPPRFRTQQALAEAELVGWLTSPAELGQPPDEIALVEAVTYDAGALGMVDYYVFGFRTFAPHWAAKNGWLAGWAGPYRHGSPPQLYASDTFSKFEPAAEKSAREHVGSLDGVINSLKRDRALQQMLQQQIEAARSGR